MSINIDAVLKHIQNHEDRHLPFLYRTPRADRLLR